MAAARDWDWRFLRKEGFVRAMGDDGRGELMAEASY
jgi:hypothetical protein